jgi:hypothetical protein
MNCCVRCFKDTYLIKHITTAAKKGNCDYCGTRRVRVLPATELQDDFEELLELYPTVEYGEDYFGDMDARDVGEDLPTIIQNEWGIFSDRLEASNKHYDLLSDILRNVDVRELRLNHPRFSSLTEHWETLAEQLKTGGIDAVPMEWTRKVRLENGKDFDIGQDVLQWLSEDLPHITMTLTNGTLTYRARPGYKADPRGRFVSFPPEEMSAPQPAQVERPGRANPLHTAVLYCAGEEETAVAEIRPSRGELISVAELQVLSDLRIVDLSRKIYFETPFGVEYLRSRVESYELFNQLGDEFAQPLRHRDDIREYIPTQFFAGWVQRHRYDGLRYPSAMSEQGQNLVFFDPSKLRVLSSKLVEVESVKVQYKASRDANSRRVAPPT